MKRIAIFLLLIGFPAFSPAKYCAACLSTFQTKTIRGQTKFFYKWFTTAMEEKNSVSYSTLKRIFHKNIRIKVNGRLMADGQKAAWLYLKHLRKEQSALVFQRQLILVENAQAALQYQYITSKAGKKYRSLSIAILRFKQHQIINWNSVSHTLPLR